MMNSSQTRDCYGQTPLHHAARFGNLIEEGGIKAILNSSQHLTNQLKARWTKLHVEATAKYAECLKDIEKDIGSLTNFPRMSSYAWMFDANLGEVIAQGKYTRHFAGQSKALPNANFTFKYIKMIRIVLSKKISTSGKKPTTSAQHHSTCQKAK